MTVEDESASLGSAPDQRPKPRWPRRSKVFGNAVAGAFLALAVLFALGVVATYFMRDRTATSPGPQTVTLTPSPKAGAADGRFFSSLAIYGISDNGNEAVRQRFMEFGHHTCFSLLPPHPQTLDSTVNGIMTAENQDVASGSPWSPQFTHDDAEHLAQAAIGAYCPNVTR
jgi:hypothetical protein